MASTVRGHHQVLLAPPGALLCGESLTLPGRRLSLLMLGGGGLAFVAQVGLSLSGQWSVVSGQWEGEVAVVCGRTLHVLPCREGVWASLGQGQGQAQGQA